jgi:hypothetical protein
MSTGPGKQAAAESIGTSPQAFDDDSDMMGRMGSQAQETPGKKGYRAPRIIFGGVALVGVATPNLLTAGFEAERPLATKADTAGEPKPAVPDSQADRR